MNNFDFLPLPSHQNRPPGKTPNRDGTTLASDMQNVTSWIEEVLHKVDERSNPSSKDREHRNAKQIMEDLSITVHTKVLYNEDLKTHEADLSKLKKLHEYATIAANTTKENRKDLKKNCVDIIIYYFILCVVICVPMVNYAVLLEILSVFFGRVRGDSGVLKDWNQRGH